MDAASGGAGRGVFTSGTGLTTADLVVTPLDGGVSGTRTANRKPSPDNRSWVNGTGGCIRAGTCRDCAAVRERLPRDGGAGRHLEDD